MLVSTKQCSAKWERKANFHHCLGIPVQACWALIEGFKSTLELLCQMFMNASTKTERKKPESILARLFCYICSFCTPSIILIAQSNCYRCNQLAGGVELTDSSYCSWSCVKQVQFLIFLIFLFVRFFTYCISTRKDVLRRYNKIVIGRTIRSVPFYKNTVSRDLCLPFLLI